MSEDWIAPAAGIVGTAVGAVISLVGTRFTARDQLHERRATSAREITDATKEFAAFLNGNRTPAGKLPPQVIDKVTHLANLLWGLRAIGAPEGLCLRCTQILNEMVDEKEPFKVTTGVTSINLELSTWLLGWRPSTWGRRRYWRRNLLLTRAISAA